MTTSLDAPYSFGPYLAALGSDWWADDPELQAVLRHHGLRDEKALAKISRYGIYAASAADAGANATDRPGELPYLTPFDDHGEPHPVGVYVPQATRRNLAAALRAGTACDPDVLVRYGMAYLLMQTGEGGVVCPLACTDGFVRAVDALDCGPEVKAAVAHIRLQSPGAPVHAAQFVTEVQGGSDAATNTVRAIPQADGSFVLVGKKWFCSNPWAQYWAVTARPDGGPDGPRGVGLFFVPRVIDGRPNGFRLDRLKDKLGTRSLPTAEMTLTGARGWPIGELQAGLSNMVRIVLSTSRFWNALSGAATLRAAERIACAYADFRYAFGRPIREYPLVAQTLEDLRRDRRAHLAGVFEVLAAWEKSLGDCSRDDRVRSRILIMLAKTCGSRRATQRVHDAMMVLAGNGIEERFSSLPRLFRDAVIMETWEGPHGLLLTRSLMDARRFGAAEDPRGFTRLLLGFADAPADDLGDRLGALLADESPRSSMVAFQAWASDLYDALGAAAWASIEAMGPSHG
jgi:alkylation response protein AidB-like acyl-CoA dehydrogenase